MPFVYSTLAAPVIYTETKKQDNDRQMPLVLGQVEIAGGSGVANKKIETPWGVRTEVTDEQLRILETNPVFQDHVKAGFVTVEKSKRDPEKIADSMNKKDPSTPKTPVDYKDKEVKPTVGKLRAE